MQVPKVHWAAENKYVYICVSKFFDDNNNNHFWIPMKWLWVLRSVWMCNITLEIGIPAQLKLIRSFYIFFFDRLICTIIRKCLLFVNVQRFCWFCTNVYIIIHQLISHWKLKMFQHSTNLIAIAKATAIAITIHRWTERYFCGFYGRNRWLIVHWYYLII